MGMTDMESPENKKSGAAGAKSVRVLLSTLVDELEIQSFEMHSYLNLMTGEVFPVADESIEAFESGAALDPLSDGPFPATGPVGEHCIALPSYYDIHEWAIMERYALSLRDDRQSSILQDVLHGSGAFRRLYASLVRMSLRDDWFAFRRREYEEIAKGLVRGKRYSLRVIGQDRVALRGVRKGCSLPSQSIDAGTRWSATGVNS